MDEHPMQISRAVRGFRPGARGRKALAAGFLIAAAVGLAPERWWWAATEVARWTGRHWPAVTLAVAAAVLLAAGRGHGPRTALGRRPRLPAVPLVVHVALVMAVTAAVAVGVGVLLWHVLGGPATVPERLDALKVVLTVVGGIGAVVALTVAYRRQRLNEADAHREASKVLLDRYTKAAELLGAPAASVRIAGAYAFAALANDAPEARQGCIDVLCAYLRQPYVAEPGQERQVRLTVIRLVRDNLHLPDDDPRTWRGHDFDFSGAVFDGGDFAGATFGGEGRVDFAHATITGTLSFESATFAGGTVSFAHARFTGGGLAFAGARFRGGEVDLRHVDPEHPPTLSGLPPAGTRGLLLPPT
ncbi:pentapeptide repeat-containing protein [Actinosynnema sp. NPDC004786]